MRGLAHCHEMGVMHRNMKPENILVDELNDENCDMLNRGLIFKA